MAFQIKKKFKADQIKSRNLDTKGLPIYYKEAQQNLLELTSPEKTTPYFLSMDYSTDAHLFLLGTPDSGQKQVMKAAGKGKEGFDKFKVSFGSCFVLKENNKNILCLYPNTTGSKGKKKEVITILKKMLRTSLKQLDEVRWLDAPLVVDAEDSSVVESVSDNTESKKEESPQIPKEEVISKAKNIKRGIERLVKDVMPRYKKRETTPKDAAFVKALRKEGHLFLSQLPLTDQDTKERLASQKETLESNLPKWKDLEGRIRSQKSKGESKAELRKSLLAVIKKMKTNRKEIKAILKRVNLKTLG